MERINKWHEYKLEGVTRNGNNVLWDFNIQCDDETEARRPAIVVESENAKERKCH